MAAIGFEIVAVINLAEKAVRYSTFSTLPRIVTATPYLLAVVLPGHPGTIRQETSRWWVPSLSPEYSCSQSRLHVLEWTPNVFKCACMRPSSSGERQGRHLLPQSKAKDLVPGVRVLSHPRCQHGCDDYAPLYARRVVDPRHPDGFSRTFNTCCHWTCQRMRHGRLRMRPQRRPNRFPHDNPDRTLNQHPPTGCSYLFVVLLRPRDKLPVRPPNCICGGGTTRRRRKADNVTPRHDYDFSTA